ncbi:Hypothetical protein CINCED_3A024820 [Cinara cedri]|uniref:Uncharacterized protein n=1 Tax=Cinara cedri TaxID=506608 RepID=A0A5E4M571_9HEMI|nr:Hypothetical protein CINCED_3A024820 [Cinara cedri]
MYALKKSPSSTDDSDSQQQVDSSTEYTEPSTSWANNNVQTSTSCATPQNAAPPASSSYDDNTQPSTSYMHSEPSTSWAHFSSATPSTSAAGDKPKATCKNEPEGSLSDNEEYLSSDESDSDDNLRQILTLYMYKRNIRVSDIIDANNSSQALIEYVNLKYIENNFKTIGLNTAFDKNNIEGAQLEFESFEKWFNQIKKKFVGPQRIKDLCVPMFSHLYLSLYTPPNQERLFQLLDKFKYLFLSKRGSIFLQELKKVTDMNQLPHRISLFRKNKYVCFVSPEFLRDLIEFFQHHRMLKLIFLEWFDINYITEEDEKTIVEEYLSRDLPQSYYNNTNNYKQSKSNNLKNISTIVKNNLNTSKSTSLQIKKDSQCGTYSEKRCDVDGQQLTKKRFLHDQQPQSSDKQLTDDKYAAGPSGLNTQKKHCGNSKSNVRSGIWADDTMDLDSSITGCSKTIEDKRKHQIDDQPLSTLNGRQSRSLHKKRAGEDTDNSSSQNESSNQKNIHKHTKATKYSRKQRKQQAHYKLSGRSKSMGDSRSSSDSSSESSEDSNSGTSFFDEESAMRKYFRYQRKSGKRLPNKTLHFLKYGNTSKIELKKLEGDMYLYNTRQIMLKNVNRLTCTLITIDHKYVAAGSTDSLIYLWERTNVPTEKEINNLSKNIKSSSRKSIYFDEREKYTEFLDKSAADVLRGHGGCIFDLAELPSAKILISASSDKTFRAWHLESKVCLEVYDEYEHRTWCITACPYSLQVATGSSEGSSCLWFLNYKRPLRIFSGHLDDILVIKFHPNMTMLATGSADKTIRVFELVTGNCQRLMLGHTDYVICLEFHPKNPKILASAAGGGEIMVWDLPTGYTLWTLRVGNVAFSELSWLADDILLASLLTGIILKCNVTMDYVKTRKSVRGFQTKFQRLMSLCIIDTIVYTIGIEGVSSIMKPNITKLQKRASIKYKQQQERATLNRYREPSPLSKLYFPDHIIENDGNSIRPLLGLSTTTMSVPKVDLEYQFNIGPNQTTQESTEFLRMNLQGFPFNLSTDDINKIISKSQSSHISLIEKHYSKPSTKQILENALLLPTQSASSSLTELPSADLNYFEEYKQKYNFSHENTSQHSKANVNSYHYSLQSHLININAHQFREHELVNSLLNIHNTALQNLEEQRIQTADREAKEKLLFHLASNIHITNTVAQEKLHMMHEEHHQKLIFHPQQQHQHCQHQQQHQQCQHQHQYHQCQHQQQHQQCQQQQQHHQCQHQHQHQQCEHQQQHQQCQHQQQHQHCQHQQHHPLQLQQLHQQQELQHQYHQQHQLQHQYQQQQHFQQHHLQQQHLQQHPLQQHQLQQQQLQQQQLQQHQLQQQQLQQQQLQQQQLQHQQLHQQQLHQQQLHQQQLHQQYQQQQYQQQLQQKLQQIQQHQLQEQQQSQVMQKLQHNKQLLSKVNVQPTQKHIQLANMNVSKPFGGSVDGHSMHMGTRQQRPTTTAGRSSDIIVTKQNYEYMRQVVIDNFRKTNPEMFIGGSQPEVKISQSRNSSPTDQLNPVKSEPESD